MPTTTYLGLEYPNLSEAPNVPQDIQDLAKSVDDKLGGIVICTSSTRPTGREGAIIYETNTKTTLIYISGAWTRYSTLDRATFPVQQWQDTTSLTGITSTAYISGTPVVGGTFVVPPSGQCFVTVTGNLRQNNDGEETRLGFEIRTGGTVGSGTIVWATSSLRGLVAGQAVNSGSPAVNSASHRQAYGSMTALSTYNIRTMHSVTGGSGNITYRVLTVEPIA